MLDLSTFAHEVQAQNCRAWREGCQRRRTGLVCLGRVPRILPRYVTTPT